MTKQTQYMTEREILDALSLLDNVWLQKRFCRNPLDGDAWMMRFVFDSTARQDLLNMAREQCLIQSPIPT